MTKSFLIQYFGVINFGRIYPRFASLLMRLKSEDEVEDDEKEECLLFRERTWYSQLRLCGHWGMTGCKQQEWWSSNAPPPHAANPISREEGGGGEEIRWLSPSWQDLASGNQGDDFQELFNSVGSYFFLKCFNVKCCFVKINCPREQTISWPKLAWWLVAAESVD